MTCDMVGVLGLKGEGSLLKFIWIIIGEGDVVGGTVRMKGRRMDGEDGNGFRLLGPGRELKWSGGCGGGTLVGGEAMGAPALVTLKRVCGAAVEGAARVATGEHGAGRRCERLEGERGA